MPQEQSSLEQFQNGLLDFFAYLNQTKDTVNKIELKSNDEIGQMANVVNKNIEDRLAVK